MKQAEKRRIVITGFHKDDAYYDEPRNRWVGLTGDFTPTPPHYTKGYFSGDFVKEDGKKLSLYAVRYKKI